MSKRELSIRQNAAETGIFLDFDGTLSEIVEVPSEARPHGDAVEVLRALEGAYRLVTIVSGRSARELVNWLGPELDIWGVHGAERSAPGSTDVVLSPVAAPFAELITTVRAEAERAVRERAVRDRALAGVVVEDKGVMVGLHYRAAVDPARARDALDEIARDLTQRHGLWRAHGRQAFELRPPIRLDKGQVVRQVVRENPVNGAVFCGDDVVDLPGFDALDELERGGATVLRVAVKSREAPAELIERADLVVEGPGGTLDFLRSLL